MTRLLRFRFISNQSVTLLKEILHEDRAKVSKESLSRGRRERVLRFDPISCWVRLYFEHVKPMEVEAGMIRSFAIDHPLNRSTEKFLINESSINQRYFFGHFAFDVALAFVQRIPNGFRPLVVTVVRFIEETRLLPFLFGRRRFVLIDRHPEIIISITWLSLRNVNRTLQNFFQRCLSFDAWWFLQTAQGRDRLFSELVNREATRRQVIDEVRRVLSAGDDFGVREDR